MEQFNLHWGEEDTAGSEHLINSTAYPAEVSCIDLEQVIKATKPAHDFYFVDSFINATCYCFAIIILKRME